MKTRALAPLLMTWLALGACNAILGNESGTLADETDAARDATGAPSEAARDALAPSPEGRSDEPPPPEAGQAVDGATPACPSGKKQCEGLCVALDDPVYGCGGASCAPCVIARGTATCAGLACAVGACNPGFADCNQSAADGCETDLSDPLHCGACNARCAAGAPYCAPQGTTFVCTTGCTAQAPTLCGTQCADTSTSVTHCGGCNNVCPTLANSQASCAGGQCQMTCNAGFGNCDNIVANGCEANLATDAANCGACGRACAPGSSCRGGACTPVDSGSPPQDSGAG